ncbi:MULTISPECIES: AraC family transcriptional regulator [Aeromonas]|uniref:AraC family transcriptional regulator n=1 Tax=Aeromonas caviae TaxID=648 RepID=A0AAW9F0V7_AERCA|nr:MULTISPECIES: AraC family transcriptional regulator [Aeromonas]PZQ98776.1 MAG: AraC family transcriptional regulator [Aeromonas media]MBP4059174.1 AraC family transcriptional regulator [Aeromonas sp. Prich7-2]MCJ7931679.1 AraC family transcriptional regulator [Aeromonas sp. LsrichE-8G]MDX7646610.1 AraC family transcriptional regulator [Aeromonas caviae]MDX7721812.1 AraC family transcriptional regulator [Aeromonas caviae]
MSTNQPIAATHQSALASRLAALAPHPGITAAPVPGVHLIYTTEHHDRIPVLYRPRMIIILQGHKVGYLSDFTFRYDPEHYLMMTLPLPCECECFASPESPLVGLSVEIDVAALQALLLEMGDAAPAPAEQGRGVVSVPLSETMLCAVERLIDVMDKPLHARVLGPQTVREILFHALHEGGAPALLAMASRHSQVSQIARVLRIMEQRFTENLTVEELAREANMSISAFHHHFKAATATSPLQYIKTLRLHRARLMMLHDGLKAGVAADKVGYESCSQFSREYKRFFGNTPSEHAARFRSGQLRIVEG